MLRILTTLEERVHHLSRTVTPLVTLLVTLLSAVAAGAQAILVAPQGVVLSNRTRTGTVELYNPSARPAEVSIRAVFGHPTTTSDGDLTLQIVEAPDSTQPSAAGFVEAFPRRLVLQPNQRQTVRLLARPPAGLAEGEYWARLIVSAKDASPRDVAAARDSGGVTVGLALEVRTIIAVNYRNGVQQTGVQLGALMASATADSLVLRAPMARTGTAAWIGTTTVRLLSASGAVLSAQTMQTAVYQTITPRFAFDRRQLPPGQYRISVDMNTDRPDVNQAMLLRSPPQHAETSVSIPGGGS